MHYNRGTKIMENTNNKNNNNKGMMNAERTAKAAERLAKANAKLEAAKVYEAKKTGYISEGLREARALRIASLTVNDLATACVARVKELTKTHLEKDLLRYLKAEVGNCIRTNVGEEKLALFVDCTKGAFKIDQAIKYACASSRNEDVKAIIVAIKKANK